MIPQINLIIWMLKFFLSISAPNIHGEKKDRSMCTQNVGTQQTASISPLIRLAVYD